MKEKKVGSGIKGFDKLTLGGFEKGSINLVSGGSGSGKSIIALQFLLEGLKKGESVLYINFEEKKEDFYDNVKELGWDLEKAEATGKFIFLEYSPEKIKMMLDEGGGAIESTVYRSKVTRMVFDSISSFSLLFDDDQSKRQAILGLFDIVRKWDTTVLLTAQHNPAGVKGKGLTYAEFEADSITLLYYMRVGSKRQRFMEILKMRGTNHSKDIYQFGIVKGGVRLGPKSKVSIH